VLNSLRVPVVIEAQIRTPDDEVVLPLPSEPELEPLAATG